MQMGSSPARALSALVLVVSIALTFLALDAPAGPCDVLLNEILAAPGRDWNGDGVVSSRDDEWVEILNTGTSAVDLAGYLLSDADSTIRYGLSGVLGAGERRLIFGLAAVDWQKANGRAISGLSFNNSGDTVRLFRILGADTVMVDAYGYKAHEGAMDRASGRRPDGGGTWALFDGLDPYTGGLDPGATGCLPTPGAPNGCPPTRSHASTWGWLKGAYH